MDIINHLKQRLAKARAAADEAAANGVHECVAYNDVKLLKELLAFASPIGPRDPDDLDVPQIVKDALHYYARHYYQQDQGSGGYVDLAAEAWAKVAAKLEAWCRSVGGALDLPADAIDNEET